jgi:DNA-binding NarL/FixJ family response regulator
MAEIDVVVVSSSSGMQRRLRQWLGRDAGLRVVGTYAARSDCAGIAAAPAMTVWDLSGVDAQAHDLAAPDLLKVAAHSRVLTLASHPDDATFVRVLALGLWGCVDAAEAEGSLAAAVHAVARGELWLPRRVLSQAYFEIARLHGGPPDAGPTLSPREHEVIVWVARGLMNKEIAQRLGISDKTVKTHLQRIFKKTRLHHRAQLAAQSLH